MTRKLGLYSVSTLLVLATLAACGGGGGGGAAPAPLATGTFTKSSALTGAGNNSRPFSATDAMHQGLYLASEINGAGNITMLRFQFSTANTASVTCPNTTIKLGQTNLTALTNTFANNMQTGQGSLATVFDNATLTLPTGDVGTWFDIPLTTPFHYNGVDNLVVQVERTTGCSGVALINTITAASNRRASTAPADATPGTADYGATGNLDAVQPLMQLVFAGGDNLAVAADRGINNSNFLAPASTGRAQFLILAGDINGSGPVTGIQFKPSAALTAAMTASHKVTLSHVPAATTQLASTTFDTNVGSNAKVVADAVTVNLPIGAAEWWVPLNGSFNYDGTSNLLIDVETTVSAGAAMIAYQNAGGNRIMAASTTAATTGTLYSRTLEPRLRIHGGPVVVLPPTAGATSAQVLGDGAAGQIQSLYRNDLIGTSGTIQNVYVRLDTSSTPIAATLANYKLYMGHTAKTNYLGSDTYVSNMMENAVVMSGTLTIPAGLKAGDWVQLPLSAPFAYDSTKNLSILFTTDISATAGNSVSMRADSNQLRSHSVGRNDNAVTSSGRPILVYNTIIDLKIDLAK